MIQANTTGATVCAPALTPKPELRHAFGRFPTGIAVITSINEDGTPYGLTINSFASVSMAPPMISWNVIRGSKAHATISQAQRFMVHILAKSQRHIAQQMASPTTDRFADITYSLSKTGLPIIEGSLATFECHVHSMIVAGDHDIILGTVGSFSHQDGPPLVYWQGGYATTASNCESGH